ncbi:MAG: hypothetical protein JXA87_07100 [Thermoleophilia bacterium]|nr:hypothetical protein [Thermoleophilia bacterium]
MTENPGEGPGKSAGQHPGENQDGAPRRAGGWRGMPYSRQAVVIIVLAVLAFYLLSRFAFGPEQMGCTDGLMGRIQWSQTTAGARLTDLWTRGSEGFDVAGAELTHLRVAWAGDGSMVQLALQGKTSVGLQLTVSSISRSGSKTMTVYSDPAALGASTTSSGPTPQATDAPLAVKEPPLAEVVASLDAVGFDGLKTVASTVPSEDEGLVLELDPDDLSQPGLTVGDYVGGGPAFTITGGELVSVDGAAALSSLTPAHAFSLSKAQLLGNGATTIAPPLAHLFVK